MSRFCHYLVRDINNCYRDGKKQSTLQNTLDKRKTYQGKNKDKPSKNISETKDIGDKTKQEQNISETTYIRDKAYKRQNTSETKHIMGNIH